MGLFSALFGKKKSFNASDDFMQNGLPSYIGGNSFLNGNKIASTSFNKKTKTIDTNVNFSPNDQKAFDTASSGIAGLTDSIGSIINPSEEQRQKYIDALYEPGKANLTSIYDKELSTAKNSAASQGVKGSLGFEKFRASELDKNLSQGLSDLYNQAQIQSYDLPSMMLNPIAQGIGLYGDVQDSVFGRVMSMLDPSFQGSQMGTNYAQNRTSSAMNKYNTQTRSTGILGALSPLYNRVASSF